MGLKERKKKRKRKKESNIKKERERKEKRKKNRFSILGEFLMFFGKFKGSNSSQIGYFGYFFSGIITGNCDGFNTP